MNEQDWTLRAATGVSFRFKLIQVSTLDNLYDKDAVLKLTYSMQLIDHGVSVDMMQKMKSAVAAIFDLPMEKKNKYAMADNDVQG